MEPTTRELPAHVKPRRFSLWLLLWAALIGAIYLPTLRTRFDFIDDGNLVYPAPAMPLPERLHLVWDKIVANYVHLGPFRPVLWCHWELEAELFRADPVLWRSARLVWAVLAAGMLLWLLRELGIAPSAAIVTAALAMWNPWRSEIWTSLTLAEGVAMPYAIGGLVCAVRAARGSRPWKWDLTGALCVLLALGCKNTFAALVPAQFLLRVLAGGPSFRAGIRANGWRALTLASTLLMPVMHFIYFKLSWHPGQYQTSPTWAQLGRMCSAIGGAISVDFVGLGLAMAGCAVVIGWRRGFFGGKPIWECHRAALLAAISLLIFGVGIYLPVEGVAGRYSMPAVWGADLGIAVLLTSLAALPWQRWRLLASAGLAIGLIAVMVQTLGKEAKFAARAELLWEVLEYVEKDAPPGSCVAWIDGPRLNAEEGIHFLWHLHNRGRTDITMSLIDRTGGAMSRPEVIASDSAPAFLVSGRADEPMANSRGESRRFSVGYWAGNRQFACHVWELSTSGRQLVRR